MFSQQRDSSADCLILGCPCANKPPLPAEGSTMQAAHYPVPSARAVSGAKPSTPPTSYKAAPRTNRGTTATKHCPHTPAPKHISCQMGQVEKHEKTLRKLHRVIEIQKKNHNSHARQAASPLPPSSLQQLPRATLAASLFPLGQQVTPLIPSAPTASLKPNWRLTASSCESFGY